MKGLLVMQNKTDVDIALISIDIKANRKNSVIIDHLKQEEEYKRANTQQINLYLVII